MLYTCFGCEREIDQRDVFPHGKRMTCRMCNKKYSLFEEIYNNKCTDLDKRKKEIEDETRKEVFGTKEQSIAKEQYYQSHPTPSGAKPGEQLDRSNVTEVARNDEPIGNFAPDIQEAVIQTRKEQTRK